MAMLTDALWHQRQVARYQEELPAYQAYANALQRVLQSAC
jgi:hypothetical protein